MNKSEPAAFLSYVRSDDEHDGGRITELRQRLEGEVKMQTGLPFHIFQDRNDILWGHQWKERLEDALKSVTFLIPIITPSFFRSSACRDEFEVFISRENMLGENQLILPIYYAKSYQLEENTLENDEIAKILRARNWADWRDYRFDSLMDARLRGAVASLASDIVNAVQNLNAVLEASQEKSLAQLIPLESSSTTSTTPQNKPKTKKNPRTKSRPQISFDSDNGSTTENLAEYSIYTREFDEVMKAGGLIYEANSLQIHKELLGIIKKEDKEADQDIFDSFEVILRRLKKDGDVCLSLLLDNSGSLSGDAIAKVAAWSSIVSRLLSEEQMPNEVLGFTTRAWKGGQSRDLWLSSGRPKSPGRLNDLRHIVYKEFDQTFQEADVNFSIMLREGLLKENIDGEAILWASDRIMNRPEKRKIIIVLSDGAPVDDSTISANGGKFLLNHLAKVISKIKSEKDIEIYGVGLNHDVSTYYGNSPTLSLNKFGTDFLNVVYSALSNNWNTASKIQRPIEKVSQK